MADALSAGLRETPGLTWLDREHLRRAADEQTLQALLSSEGAGRRLVLGQQLRADALLLVATETRGAQRVLRIIVIDCGTGARLSDEHVAASGEAAAPVAAVRRAVDQTRARFAGGVRCVVGVPNFVSRNFEHDYDQHQSGYAALLADALIAQPGVAVLEVQEARALAAEAEAARIAARLVPLIVEGEFRVSRAAHWAEPAVDFAFRVLRAGGGETAIKRDGVPMSAASAYVGGELPREILKFASIDAQPALSPAEQFAALSARADAFARLGAWEHSVPLREAALLVKPEDAPARVAAADEYLRLLERDVPRNLSWKQDRALLEQDFAQRAKHWLIVLNHLEHLIRNRQVRLEPAARLLQRATISLHKFGEPAVEALLPQMRQMEREKRDFLRQVSNVAVSLPREDKYGKNAAHYGFHFWHQEVVRLGLIRIDDPRRENPNGPHVPVDLEWWGELHTELLPEVPVTSSELADKIYTLAHKVTTKKASGVTEAQFVAFLDRLDRAPRRHSDLYARLGRMWLRWAAVRTGSDTSAAAIELRREAEQLRADAKQRLAASYRGSIEHYAGVLIEDVVRRFEPAVAKAPEPEPAAPVVPAVPTVAGKIRFETLALRLRTTAGRETPMPEKWQAVGGNDGTIHQVLACDDRFDLLFAPEAVMIHREKGVLDLVLDEPGAGFTAVAWDGKHVWAASQHKGVWLLDRQGQTIARATEANGLPPADNNLLLVAIAPGKVLAIGSHGENRRAWVGIIQLAPAGALDVNVFHHATRVAKEGERDAVQDAGLCFYPSFVEPLGTTERGGVGAAGKGPVRAVLVGRAAENVGAGRWPLHVELDPPKVSVRNFPSLISESPVHYLLEDGRVLNYFMDDLCVFDAPEVGRGYRPLFPVQFGGRPLSGKGLPYQGSVYFPGTERWCRVDPSTLAGEIIEVAEDPAASAGGHGPPDWLRRERAHEMMWWRFGVSAHYGLVTWKPRGSEFHRVIVPPKTNPDP